MIWADEAVVSSDEDFSGGEEVQEAQPRAEDQELKEKLLRRFGGRISSLKLEFSKKKKKGKLPKEARQTLLEWWNIHYKWPYPTVNFPVSLHLNNAVPRLINVDLELVYVRSVYECQ